MALKVYGSPASFNVVTVLLTLFEKQVKDFEIVDINLLTGAHKEPSYVAKQPFGLIPCIQDEDFILYESRAIVRYLADKFAGQGSELYPQAPAARALVDQWVEVQAQNLVNPAWSLTYEKWFSPTLKGKPGDQALIAKSMKELGLVLDIYEARLSTSKYLAGDFFSLAEIVHMGSINYILFAAPVEGAQLLGSRRHVQAWWNDITSRPAWAKVVELWDNVWALIFEALQGLKTE